MTRLELEAANIEFQRQAELDRLNIHNKLDEPERQPNETLNQYKERLKKRQIINGYDQDDYIFPAW